MALTVNMKPFVAAEDEFFALSASNPELRFKCDANEEVISKPPAGDESGSRSGSDLDSAEVFMGESVDG